MAGEVAMRKTPSRQPGKKQAEELKLRRKLKAQLIIESAGRCQRCRSTGDFRGLDLAHIVPLSRGGQTVATNCQILCRSCHVKKYHGIKEC